MRVTEGAEEDKRKQKGTEPLAACDRGPLERNTAHLFTVARRSERASTRTSMEPSLPATVSLTRVGRPWVCLKNWWTLVLTSLSLRSFSLSCTACPHSRGGLSGLTERLQQDVERVVHVQARGLWCTQMAVPGVVLRVLVATANGKVAQSIADGHTSGGAS